MKADGYHWERKPYGCSYSLQKNMAPSEEVVEADMVRSRVVLILIPVAMPVKIENGYGREEWTAFRHTVM